MFSVLLYARYVAQLVDCPVVVEINMKLYSSGVLLTSWRLKSPTARLILQQLIQTNRGPS